MILNTIDSPARIVPCPVSSGWRIPATRRVFSMHGKVRPTASSETYIVSVIIGASQRPVALVTDYQFFDVFFALLSLAF
jgi:hypothetical protein